MGVWLQKLSFLDPAKELHFSWEAEGLVWGKFEVVFIQSLEYFGPTLGGFINIGASHVYIIMEYDTPLFLDKLLQNVGDHGMKFL